MLSDVVFPKLPFVLRQNSPNTNPIQISHSVSTNILPLPRQRLKHPRRQLVSNQARKDHEILCLLQQLVRQLTPHWVVKPSCEQVLAMPRTAANAPEQHVTNVACDLRGVGREGVGFGADFADVAFSGEGEDFERLNGLGEESVRRSVGE
jgi:hypothetical protein